MGGWMTYQRMRSRNNLLFRKPDDDLDPYWRDADNPPSGASPSSAPNWWMLTGDMNRMELGYLIPEALAENDFSAGGRLETSPLHQAAESTGVDVETVRKVLRYVFLDQQ